LKNNRAVIFANGILGNHQAVLALIKPGDVIIAADGGASHCLALGIRPDIIIGDFDSLDDSTLDSLKSTGSTVIQHPAEKNFTDLELAVFQAQSMGINRVIILAALGARWDQTLANLLLPAATHFQEIDFRLVDGQQQVTLIRPHETIDIQGKPGDIVSLIPIGGDANGVTTSGLQYPLKVETLFFGTTRGISNLLSEETASVRFENGLMLCMSDAHVNFVKV
jgi:thiamine pyrophosphokinase